MSQALQERNKALVLEAFDTLFNERDYRAAERYWAARPEAERKHHLRAISKKSR